MEALAREDLYSLEEYARLRPDFRRQVMEHKKNRVVPVGPNVTLYFEDRLTMQYQIQEMLRVERIFEPEGIDEELDAYNPLIPEGSNWKATLMIEYPEVAERRQWLARLLGIEQRTYVQIAGFEPVFPIANEDLERSTAEKTSSVHFLRFELSAPMAAALKAGAALAIGVEHEHYRHRVEPVAEAVRASLAADLT